MEVHGRHHKIDMGLDMLRKMVHLAGLSSSYQLLQW